VARDRHGGWNDYSLWFVSVGFLPVKAVMAHRIFSVISRNTTADSVSTAVVDILTDGGCTGIILHYMHTVLLMLMLQPEILEKHAEKM
jgi:hypothetical protein